MGVVVNGGHDNRGEANDGVGKGQEGEMRPPGGNGQGEHSPGIQQMNTPVLTEHVDEMMHQLGRLCPSPDSVVHDKCCMVFMLLGWAWRGRQHLR